MIQQNPKARRSRTSYPRNLADGSRYSGLISSGAQFLKAGDCVGIEILKPQSIASPSALS
jgi:hypothetical protein